MYLYNQSDINSPESVSIKITDCEKTLILLLLEVYLVN